MPIKQLKLNLATYGWIMHIFYWKDADFVCDFWEAATFMYTIWKKLWLKSQTKYKSLPSSILKPFNYIFKALFANLHSTKKIVTIHF